MYNINTKYPLQTVHFVARPGPGMHVGSFVPVLYIIAPFDSMFTYQQLNFVHPSV